MCLSPVTCDPWELGLVPLSVPTRLVLRSKEMGEMRSLTPSASFPCPHSWVKTRMSQRTVTILKNRSSDCC